MTVTGIALGVGGREHGVYQNESADDLSGQTSACTVPQSHRVCSSSISHVESSLEPLRKACTADCSQALSYHVCKSTR